FNPPFLNIHNPMEDNRKILPAYSHHHQCLQLSPHCPQHAAYRFPPNTHHHHHLHLSPDCPLHRHLLLLPPCPLHTPTFHPINQSSIPFPQNTNFDPIPPEAEHGNEQQEEDDEEFTYVLTDEWKDFFAKSEAKRRLAKKQGKKKGKD
ncbi:hypothetical protein M8C21_032466, partial [Ambrosia artemisiifolia]